MSDKDEAKVNESKESSGSNNKSHKKNDGTIDAKSSSSSTISGNNNDKGNKIQKTEPSPSSTTTKPSSSSSSSSSTQTRAEKPVSVPTSTTNTTTNTQTEIDSANSHTVQKSNVINPIPEYNNLNRESLSVPKITSNYFCFDCGAIMTTIEDKEEHMKIESERKNNSELITEE